MTSPKRYIEISFIQWEEWPLMYTKDGNLK